MNHISGSKVLQKFTPPLRGQPPDPPKSSGSIAVFPTSPLDLPAETFENALKRREKNHRVLIQWIRKNLKPDVDYGRTHIVENCKYARTGAVHLCSNFNHMSMITLWKSGAEKICRMLGLSAHFPNVHQYELAAVHLQKLRVVVLKCELKTNKGIVVAEGSGARHIKQDDWNLNTSIKMAAKSAMVDATIRVAGLSSVFIKTHKHTLTRLGDCNKTDMPDSGACKDYDLTSMGVRKKYQNHISIQYITQRQKDFILKLAGRLGLTIEVLNKRCKGTFNSTLKTLERHHASKLISQLNGQFLTLN